MGPLVFDNSFARLPSRFHTFQPPSGLSEPWLVALSPEAAGLIGQSPSALETGWLDVLAANRVPAGAQPLASVYSGHQFGVWAGQLGDGRALLIGEAPGPDGRHWELQWKGSGQTPYSRRADGRAVLRSSIREFLCSEAMHHLGIPTTRALSVVGSDQPTLRETVEPSAIVLRMAPSFVRFGHFEHFYAAGDTDALRTLADYVIERCYPELADAGRGARPGDEGAGNERYGALLEAVTRATARLMARWQAVGFCHGVMNTDNMSVLGLTIDYGPFGFIDGFRHDHVCNHSDEAGRYSYGNQPGIGEWNCYCLGQALMPLIGSVEEAERRLSIYRQAFVDAWAEAMRAKLGLEHGEAEDQALFESLFALMHQSQADFTLFFRAMSRIRKGDDSGDRSCRDLIIDRPAFDAWATRYRERLAREARDDASRARAMDRVNPLYVLRNHLAEEAIRAAGPIGIPLAERDFGPVRELLEVLRRPFDEQPGREHYSALPPSWASALSVSCSS